MKLGRRISVTLLNAKNWRTPFGIMLLVFFITPRLTSAQALTTGSISGSVVDPQGGLLPGVSITATHQPTGTTYEAVTNGEGRFEIFSVRVGGPYRVVAALSGFREQTEAVETVGLGENRTIEFKLTLASVTENVTVTAEVPNIDSTRAGTAANIRSETIENLPSISRSMFDYARTSPFVSLNQDSAGGEQVINVAGRNNRYNNMQIDGAVNNDVFAISSSSTPGSAAGTQPISLDVDPGSPDRDLALRRAAGRFFRRVGQRRHQERRQRVRRYRLLVPAQSSSGGRSPLADERSEPDLHGHEGRHLQRQAGWLQFRRADYAEQGVLLRQLRYRPEDHAHGLFAGWRLWSALAPHGRSAADPGHRQESVPGTTQVASARSRLHRRTTSTSSGPTSTSAPNTS